MEVEQRWCGFRIRTNGNRTNGTNRNKFAGRGDEPLISLITLMPAGRG